MLLPSARVRVRVGLCPPTIGQEQDKGATVSGHGPTLTLTLADGSIVGSKFANSRKHPANCSS